jgi:hypothetical protein
MIKAPDVQQLFDDNDPCLEQLHTSVDKENYNVEKVAIKVENRKPVLTVEFGRKLVCSLSVPLRLSRLRLRIEFNEPHGST